MNSLPAESKNTTTTDGGKSGLFTYNRFMLKAKYSLYSALVFFLFANPETILILQRFFGKFVDFITPCGAPTIGGIFVTTALFFTTMLGLMLLPSE
jgi:hypothetical protein